MQTKQKASKLFILGDFGLEYTKAITFKVVTSYLAAEAVQDLVSLSQGPNRACAGCLFLL